MAIWNKKSQASLPKPKTPTEYPSGTFIQTELGYFFIVSPNKRHRIVSERVLQTWSPPRVVETTEAAVVKYRVSGKMTARNGSLIWNIGDGKIYLVENGKRRHVVSPEALELIGATLDSSRNVEGVHVMSKDEIELHEQGEDLG